MKKYLLFIILTALSYYLNTVTVSLYYGVHLLFGSIPLFILLKKLGVWPAFVGAIIAQSYTIFLWNHPFAVILFSLEILFVGLFFRRKLTNIILRDGLYWMLVGIPLVFLFYGRFLGFGLEGTIMVALKDMMNGMFNVWVAELLFFLYLLIERFLKKEKGTPFYTLREAVSYLGGGLLLTLSFILVLLIGFYEQEKDQSQVMIKTQDKLDEITRFYSEWTEQRLEDHRFLIERLEAGSMTLQEFEATADQFMMRSSFEGIEFEQQVAGEGISYLNQGGETLMTIRSSLDDDERIATSFYSLEGVRQYVLGPLSMDGMTVSLISGNEEAVFTNDPIIENRDSSNSVTLGNFDEGTFLTYDLYSPAMQQWKQSGFTLTGETFPDSGEYFIVKASFTPFIDYQLMNQALFIILMFVSFSLILGEYVSYKILARFESLSRNSSEVVENLPHIASKENEFPSSMIYEFNNLSKNFHFITKEWQDKYMITHKMNEELQEKRRELEASQKKMEYLAHYDALTRLPNRRKFNQTLKHYIEADQRIGLLFIDLDRFKSINDQYGHETGDLFLQEIAARLQKTVGEGEVYRLSGDEFTVLVTPLQNPEEMSFISKRIARSFHEPVEVNGKKVTAQLSVGVSVYPDQAKSQDDLIRIADHAMYREKHKNRTNGGM
ncbi:diguanylate cyclase [Halobacillus fulvus]|nr:diguanylate cyclase [Halobacillus fulvus]